MPSPAISSSSTPLLPSRLLSSSASFLNALGKSSVFLGARLQQMAFPVCTMEVKGEDVSQKGLYQPKIADGHIRTLYRIAKRQGVPMTKLVNLNYRCWH